jgi:hypothetical protein
MLQPRPFPSSATTTSSNSDQGTFYTGSTVVVAAAANRPASLEGLDETRRIYLQAAIVRLLKARRRITLGELVTCMQAQCPIAMPDAAAAAAGAQYPGGGFAVGEEGVRQAVAQLLDKGYLEAGDVGTSEYLYVA